MNGTKIIKSSGLKNLNASWVKDISTASWISPVGNAPELTAEQTSQNEAGTHEWRYHWNEADQQWDLTDRLA